MTSLLSYVTIMSLCGDGQRFSLVQRLEKKNTHQMCLVVTAINQ